MFLVLGNILPISLVHMCTKLLILFWIKNIILQGWYGPWIVYLLCYTCAIYYTMLYATLHYAISSIYIIHGMGTWLLTIITTEWVCIEVYLWWCSHQSFQLYGIPMVITLFLLVFMFYLKLSYINDTKFN